MENPFRALKSYLEGGNIYGFDFYTSVLFVFLYIWHLIYYTQINNNNTIKD